MDLRLIVMRHAKASLGGADHERPLDGTGQEQAPRVGARLRDLEWVPERVVSSDARRTRETLEGMRTQFGSEVDVRFTRSLYEAGLPAIRATLLSVPHDTQSVLVLGHNPGWEEALQWLTGRIVPMRAGTAALLEYSGGDWTMSVSQPGRWTLVEVVAPENGGPRN